MTCINTSKHSKGSLVPERGEAGHTRALISKDNLLNLLEPQLGHALMGQSIEVLIEAK